MVVAMLVRVPIIEMVGVHDNVPVGNVIVFFEFFFFFHLFWVVVFVLFEVLR